MSGYAFGMSKTASDLQKVAWLGNVISAVSKATGPVLKNLAPRIASGAAKLGRGVANTGLYAAEKTQKFSPHLSNGMLNTAAKAESGLNAVAKGMPGFADKMTNFNSPATVKWGNRVGYAGTAALSAKGLHSMLKSPDTNPAQTTY